MHLTQCTHGQQRQDHDTKGPDAIQGFPIASLGTFTWFDVLIAVRGFSQDHLLSFEVEDYSTLQRVQYKTILVAQCTFQYIRVEGIRGRVWHVDEIEDDPNKQLQDWEQQPLARLSWNPHKWLCHNLSPSPTRLDIPFFQYTTYMG